jgi:4-hydroxy-3-methylbut-2-enyl diphosphate reductase
LTTYFIDSEEKLLSAHQIQQTNWRNKEEIVVDAYLPLNKETTILMTSGASCPDTVVEASIRKIAQFYQVEAALENIILQGLS